MGLEGWGAGRATQDAGRGAGQDEERRVATIDGTFGFGWRAVRCIHLHRTKAWRAVAHLIRQVTLGPIR